MFIIENNFLVGRVTARVKVFLFYFIFVSIRVFSQDPSYFQLNTENGLPSNEIYSLIQDSKGFIWFGSDAGIYKFDGVRCKKIKSNSQKSKALTGLCISSSGRIYSYNFSGQLFYIENDSLINLSEWNGKISNITCDDDYNLWVCGEHGISSYNEKSRKWRKFDDFDSNGKVDQFLFTHSCRVNNGVVSFICFNGIASITKEKLFNIPVTFENGTVASEYILEVSENESWLFHRSKPIFYKIADGKVQELKSSFLNETLKDSKLTDIRILKDGLLYITTYSGLIIYDPKLDKGVSVFDSKAVSGAILDQEENFWVSTLQNGLLRIPNFNIKHWIINKVDFGSQKVNKIITVDSLVYTTNINGELALLNPSSNLQNVFSLDKKADIQCLFYDSINKSICFNINNNLYSFKDKRIEILNTHFTTAKYILPIHNEYIVASSVGAFIFKNLRIEQAVDTLTNAWSREITFDCLGNRLFVATNEGLIVYKSVNSHWIANDTFFTSKQVSSLAFDTKNKLLYALTFENKVFVINGSNSASLFLDLPSNMQATQLRLNEGVLYIATNLGLFKYNLELKKQELINRLDGLSSNEVIGVDFIGKTAYVATALGVNQIPSSFEKKQYQSYIYVDEINIDGKLVNGNELIFDYKQKLSLKLSGISYSSNATFKYAYRIVSSDSNWISLPSTIESLDIQSMPYGNFVLEVKVINHLGKDSENTIRLIGYVKPPFWLRFWFIALMLFFLMLVFYFIFLIRVKKIRKKQLEELKKIKLENELRLVQQSALKAQMNPHFIFNVLNSIKGYIYDNDKKNAVLYLSEFSDLMRKVLDNSSNERIKLSEEIEILRIYIELEAMLLEGEFSHEIILDKNIDVDSIEIPGLLIQPYVENAFKHGLRHKKGEKKLTLSISLLENENLLIVEIVDNGVGQEVSKQINMQNKKTHKSFASKATSKRIDLLNSGNKDAISVDMKDRAELNKEQSGTIVKLRILIHK